MKTMNNEEKKRHLENLLTNKMFVSALEHAPNDEEREKIKSFAQDVFLNIVEGLSSLDKLVKDNPEKMAEVLSKHIPKK